MAKKQAPEYDKSWIDKQWQYEYAPTGSDIWGQSTGPQTTYVTDPVTKQRIPYAEWEAKNKQKQEEYRIFQNFQRGLDAQGNPIAPEYESMLDPATGRLKKEYVYTPQLMDPNTLEGYQALKKRVLTEGPSAWANLMIEKQKVEEQSQREAADRQTRAALATGYSDLAMRGGLRSGARERLAGNSLRDLMLNRQNVLRGGTQNRLGILSTDEQNRMNLLPQFAQGEANLSQWNIGQTNAAEQANIQRAMEEKRLAYQTELDKWKKEMENIASEREAQATERSGGGGGK